MGIFQGMPKLNFNGWGFDQKWIWRMAHNPQLQQIHWGTSLHLHSQQHWDCDGGAAAQAAVKRRGHEAARVCPVIGQVSHSVNIQKFPARCAFFVSPVACFEFVRSSHVRFHGQKSWDCIFLKVKCICWINLTRTYTGNPAPLNYNWRNFCDNGIWSSYQSPVDAAALLRRACFNNARQSKIFILVGGPCLEPQTCHGMCYWIWLNGPWSCPLRIHLWPEPPTPRAGFWNQPPRQKGLGVKHRDAQNSNFWKSARWIYKWAGPIKPVRLQFASCCFQIQVASELRPRRQQWNLACFNGRGRCSENRYIVSSVRASGKRSWTDVCCQWAPHWLRRWPFKSCVFVCSFQFQVALSCAPNEYHHWREGPWRSLALLFLARLQELLDPAKP